MRQKPNGKDVIRDPITGRVKGTKPRPRLHFRCECGDHSFCNTSLWGVALLSPEDDHLFTVGALTLDRSGKTAYAMLRVRKYGFLHQYVLPVEKPLEPDHRNGNGLDCRRANLRPLTRSQNIRNARPRALHGFIGVTFHKASGLWRGYVNDTSKQHSAGYFRTAEDAAKARDALIVKMGFNTATLNYGGRQ